MGITKTHLLYSVRRMLVICSMPKMISMRYSSYVASFREALKSANNVVVISGDEISKESGVPVYGPNGQWRKYQASRLSTSGAFLTFPSLVWEFYHYRREIAAKAQPNPGHKAIAEFEARHANDKSVTVITQSVDGLHTKAGTKNLVELLGNLYKTRCIRCEEVLPNHDNPICEALANRGSPDITDSHSDIPEKSLPHCNKASCGGLLKPHIVGFGESLDPDVLKKAEEAMEKCDVCLVIGKSSLLFPAALYGSEALARGATVAEFNTDPYVGTEFHYYFEGPLSTTLPEVLAP